MRGRERRSSQKNAHVTTALLFLTLQIHTQTQHGSRGPGQAKGAATRTRSQQRRGTQARPTSPPSPPQTTSSRPHPTTQRNDQQSRRHDGEREVPGIAYPPGCHHAMLLVFPRLVAPAAARTRHRSFPSRFLPLPSPLHPAAAIGTAMSVHQWMQRHVNDPYVKASRKQELRSRAAFKLKVMRCG